MKRPHLHSNFELEALEPRILLSADAAELLLPGATEAVEVAVTSAPEQNPLPEQIQLSGDQLYPAIEGKDLLVNADGVWDSEGQLLAQELTGLNLAADSVVIADGVDADGWQIDAASIYMGEVNWSGGSVLHSDTLSLSGKQSGTADSSLSLAPRQKDAGISLGTGTSGFSLDSDALDYLSGSGIGELIIGQNEGTHIFTIDGLSYEGNLTLQAPLLGGHFNVVSEINHAGGTLKYIGSGHTQTANADTITAGADISVNDSLQLGLDAILYDTTNGGAVATGANIEITGAILGKLDGTGGILTLDAGTNGDILINGDIGTSNLLNGLVIRNARNVILNGNILLDHFTQTNGTGNTTIGDSASDTFAIRTGNIDITTHNNVTVNGPVTINNGNIDITVNPASTGTAKIHFKETVTLSNGDITLPSAKNVEFTKDLSVAGDILQSVGAERTVFSGQVNADRITVSADQAITFNRRVELAEGDLILTSNDVNFNGGSDSIIGALNIDNDSLSHLLIRPVDNTVRMEIGSTLGGTGFLKFTTDDIVAIANGFIDITIGYDSGSTNEVLLGNAIFSDALNLYGGTFLVNATLRSQESMIIEAAVGGIEVRNTQIQVSNDQINSVWQSSDMRLTALQGDITFTNGGSLRILNQDDADLTQGSLITLDAQTGSILNAAGSFGFITARDLVATAGGKIVLLSEIKNLTATSTTAGNITIDELDDLHVISAVTEDGAVSLTSGGNTTLDLVQSLTDAAGNDISMQVFNGDLDVGQVLAGTLGNVLLETEGALTGFTPQILPHVVGNELTLTAIDGVGEGSVPLLIQGNSLTATNTGSGAVVISQISGRTDLVTSIVNDAAGSSDHVYLSVDANLEINSTGIHSASDAGIGVSSTGNILVNGNFSGQGGLLSLVANGNLEITAGLSLASGGGGVSVVSSTGTFAQAADSSIVSGGGDITLSAFLNATLGLLDARNLITPADQSTWGNVAIGSGGAVRDSLASTLMNVYANTLAVSTQNGIGELDGTTEKGLEIDVAILAATTLTGDIALKDINDLTVGTAASVDRVYLLADGTESLQLSSPVLAGVLNQAGNILLSAGGLLTAKAFDVSSSAVETEGAGTVALVAGSMSVEGSVVSAGGNLSLNSTHNISLLNAGDLLTGGTGNVGVSSSAGSILAGADQSIFTGTGTILLSAFNALELGTVETTGAVGLKAANDNILAANGGTDTRTVVTGDTLAINAYGVNGPSSSGEALHTDVNTLSLIGGAGPEFRIQNAGTLTINTTSAAVDLYNTLLATAALTVAAQHDVDVSGNGNIEIIFDAGDGILAAGRLIRTHGAGEIVLTADGAFTMGSTSKISNENGNIDIDAQNTVSVTEVSSTDGDITVSSATGSIIDNDPAETPVDFSTLGQLDLTAATGIGIEAGERQTLNVLLGTLSAETATGGIFVTSAASFATNGLLSTGGNTPISVISEGDLTVGPNMGGVAVDATGDVILLADGNLTQLVDSTIDAGGDIRLSSGATITLVDVETLEDVALTALALVRLPASTGSELSANGLFLDNVGSVGSAAQPMHFAISRIAGTVNSGTLAFENDGDLALGLVTVETTAITPMGTLPAAPYSQSGDRLTVNGGGEGILTDITGSLTVDAGTGFALTVSEAVPVLWQSTGAQTWGDAFSLSGGDLTLRTEGILAFTAGGSSATGGGNVSLEVGVDLTFSITSGINTGAGSLLARVGNSLSINGAIISSASVGLIAGTDISATSIGGPVRVTAADLLLTAGVKISTGLVPLTTDVDQLTAFSGAGGVYVSNQGDVNITNLGFSVPSLQTDGSVDVGFSGHQGGIRTVQAGAIGVNTTGTMTVQEVAAVIEAFPGTDNAISIVADQAGPDGNQLNILFDIVDSGSAGNPPTTVYTPETGLLTVTLRKDVSTLQEIIDAINADPDFAVTAVLARGPMDGSQVFTLATNEDFAFFAEGGRREGVLVGVSAVLSGGLEPISAVSQILLPGEFYNILFTSLNPGNAANAFEVRLLDDGPGGNLTNGADEAMVSWNEPGGKLDIYINYGVTTVGTLLNAVSDAQTNDSLPFSAELDGFFLPSDLNDVLGDAGVTLQSNLSASANLRPTGGNNDLQITATVGGQLYNQIKTEFVDDGSVSTLGVRADFNDIDNLLTVYIQSGTTTANQVMSAINSQGTFSASLLQENSGGTNTGAGAIQANVFKLHSGAVGVNAVANLVMSNADNDLVLTADVPGADENGIEIRLLRDASVPIGQATATYDAGTRVLEVRLNSAFATAGNVLTAINTAGAGVLSGVIAPANSGFGGIVLADYPETAGGTGGPPEAVYTATGFNNDFELVADSNSPLYENIQVFLIDDGTITDGSATAAYLSGPKHLILNVQSGVTTLNDLLTVLNSDAGIPVSGTLLAGNDGSGTFNIPAQAFIGGADPVKARASTLLPSGAEIVLEADDGGIARNGIQVVYALNPSLVPNTAAASLFEVDGIRLLQIQVQSSTTTLDKIALALSNASLPFSIANLGAIASLTAGNLALRTAAVQEGSLRLTANHDISLIGRVQSETGPVSITTQGTGNLTFDSETARVYAISKAEISLAGSFANLMSTEDPLVKVFGNGLLSILAAENTVSSELPVQLTSGGNITIGGTGGLSLNDQNLNVDAGGDITISGPIDAGTGNNTLNAGAGINITSTGPISGMDLVLNAVDDILQNGNLTATGAGTIDVTSTSGSILMGANAVTSSDTGTIIYTADGDVGITAISSTSGNIDVISGGFISDTHAVNGNNLATGGITTLTAQTGIGSTLTGDLKTRVGDLQLRNLGTSGDIVITEQAAGGDLNITELTQDAVSGWSIINVDNGNLTFSGPVTHSSDGSLVIGVNGSLLVQDVINLNGGDFSTGVFGDVTFDKDVNTAGGDVGVAAGGILSMDPAMTLNADGGNVLLQADGNVLLSHVLSPDADVRIESTAASVLRAANDGSTNVVAGILQLEAAISVGALTTLADALITDVTRLNASAKGGVLAVSELNSLLIGNSTVTVNFAQIDKTTIAGSWNESQLLTQTGAAVVQVGGALTVETSVLDPTLAIDGNFLLSSGGILTLSGDTQVTNGSAQIVSTSDMLVNGNLNVTGGTLLMQSGGLFTQDPASVITVTDDHASLNSAGVMTLSRVDTGTGDLALRSNTDLLVDAAAPAVQLSSSGLRLESGGAIGSVANPVNLASDTLSALAVNGIHLNVTGDVDVNSVGVTVDTVSLLGLTTGPAFVDAALADLESTGAGNILVSVSGLLEINDGDADEKGVLTNGAGVIYIEAGSLDAYADIQTVDGEITIDSTGAAHWISVAKVLSTTGDLHIVSGATLTMDDQSLFRSTDGNILVDSAGLLLLGSVQAANGLVAIDALNIQDNGNTRTDIIADEAQILSDTWIGELGPYDAIDVDVNLIAARANGGGIVISELSAASVGAVSGSVAKVDLAGIPDSTTVNEVFGLTTLNAAPVSFTAAGTLTLLSNGSTADAVHVVRAGLNSNIFLQSSASRILIQDAVSSDGGHITMRGASGITMSENVPVSTNTDGTISLFSANGPIGQTAGSQLISENKDIVLQAAGNISLAEIQTNARVAVTSLNGAILDNNAAALNVSSSSLRLFAGLNIATGLNPLETAVATLSAKTLNGAMYLSEADNLEISGTQALTQVMAADASLTPTPVAVQTGLTTGGAGGTIVLSTVAGGLTVNSGNAVSASQTGNILLSSLGILDLDSSVSSGSGSITLETQSDFDLAAGLLVSTGGAGQIHVLAAGNVLTGAESRFVNATGNQAMVASGNITLGGISSTGRVVIASATGSVQGAGSTTFDFEVIAIQLALVAEQGGVGSLSPVLPVSPFRTSVSRIAGSAGAGGLNLVNDISVTVDLVSVSLQRVQLDGSLLAVPTYNQYDLQTVSGNGSIVLRSTTGAVTLNEGGDADGLVVAANGSGNVRIAAALTLTANSDVISGSGNLTLRSVGNLISNGDITTGGTGDVYLRSDSGALTMGTTATAIAGANMFLRASNDVTLGNLFAVQAATTTVNGKIINGAASGLNFSGSNLRLDAKGDIGSTINALMVDAQVVSAVSNGGSLYLDAAGDIAVGQVGFNVNEVLNDASVTPVTVSNLTGLITIANNGNIVLTADAGSLTLNNPVTAHGSGNILLSGNDSLVASVDIRSTTGHISLISASGTGIELQAGVDVATTGAGSIYVDAGTGSLVMNASATLSAPGGSLRVLADGDLSLANTTALNTSLISESGAIIRVAGTVTSTGLRISAEDSVGSGGAHLRIATATLSAESANGDLFFTETDSVTVTGVTVNTAKVGSNGAATIVTDESLADLSTGNNGDIVLVTLAGSLTLNDGGDEDFLAVEAHGTGNIRLEAPVNVAINSGISSGTGHVTLIAGGNMTAGPGVVVISTAQPGTVSLRANGGVVTMTGLTQILATDSSVRVSGTANLTLGNISAANVSLLSTGGSIVNAAGTSRNVTATNLRINAATGLGTDLRHLTTAVSTLSGRAGSGGAFITELNALTIGGVTVTVTEYTATGGTTLLTDAAQSDLRATAGGDVLLVTGDTLTLGTVVGDIVNLISAGAILNNAVSTPNVAAASLLLNAQSHIGSVAVPLLTDVDVLSAHSISGDIFIADAGDVLVGAVGKLATPALPSDTQSDIITDAARTVVLAAQGDLTLGRITSGTVALVSGNRILKTPASTLNVDADALRIQTLNGAGAPGAYLITRVDTFAAQSENGDILISDNEGITIGSVTVSGLISAGDTLTGVTTVSAGDVVILSDDVLTVNSPVNAIGNVRLSAEGILTPGTVTGVDVSLISSVSVAHPSGLIAATHLRVNSGGNVGSLIAPLKTQADVISVLSVTGSVFVLESDDAELGSVAVTAGGVTDAVQHGISAPVGITLSSSTGRFLDGGDTDADIRTDGLVTLITATGLGRTGTGAVDIAADQVTLSSSGNGNVYMDLLESTTLDGISLAGHGYLYLNVVGDLTLTDGIQLTASSGAFLSISGLTTLQANVNVGRDLRISSGSLLMDPSVEIISATGNLRIRTLTTLGMSAASLIQATTGSVLIQSGTDMVLGLVTGGSLVDLRAGGNLSGVSANRSTHQITGASVRLSALGVILPVLTDAEQMDVNAGGVSEIYELDDLVVGRYGLRLINEQTGDTLTLRMNEAELSSYNGVAVVPGVGTFVWTSDAALTLGTHLMTDNGDIQVTADSLQQSGALGGAYLDAANGRVTLAMQNGAGTADTNPVTIDAAEFTAGTNTGVQAYQVDGAITLTADGITTATGTGKVQLVVDNGDLTQAGRIVHTGSGVIDLKVNDGRLNVLATGLGTNPLIQSGGNIQLLLDTGISLSGASRLLMQAARFSATSRTGNLLFDLRAASGTQIFLDNFLIQEGTGSLDILSTQALVLFGTVRNQAAGNLNMQSNFFISQAAGSLIYSQNGVLSLTAQELELARVESYGSATNLRATTLGIKVKPGYTGTNIFSDHTVRADINTTIVGFRLNAVLSVYDVSNGAFLTNFAANTTINYTAP